jgi:hypothetical protein
MATQGLVSVRKDGKVIMKFVAGSNGFNATKVAAAIRRKGEVPKSLLLAYEMATKCGFGSEDNLVIMDDINIEFHGDEQLPERYRKTFSQPEFNPRWDLGIADYMKVVDL